MRYLRLYLLLVTCALPCIVAGQTATYHLHKEASVVTTSFDKLLSTGPDFASTALTVALKSKAAGEYVIKEFETQAGVPNAGGAIPNGSILSFSLWMRKTANVGTVFPRAKIRLNNATGALFCTATGTAALTTTVTRLTFSCTTTADITMAAADRFYLWVGVNLTATSTTTFNGELDVEGTLNGNFDSQITLPLATGVPTITNLTPNVGAISSSVVIAGSNFRSAPLSGSIVKFNGTATTPTLWSATNITAPVPNGVTIGNAPVIVTVGGQSSAAVSFTVTAAPSITSLTPNTGANGSSVTIAGANFNPQGSGSTVTFGSVPAAITGWTTSSITVTVPPTAATGNVVVTAAGGVTSPPGVPFTVTPAPSITSLTPNTSANGSSVTIAGANFNAQGSDSKVTFGGVQASITGWATSSIAVTVPPTAATGNVVVTAAGGVASPGVPFTVTPAPSITGLTPSIGANGSSVTIAGANFNAQGSDSTVTFGSVPAAITGWTTSSITVTVPPTAATGNVVVTVAGGVASPGVPFTVTPAPSITGLTPNTGANRSSVTIAGANFNPQGSGSTVTFGSVPAAITGWTTSSITVTIPPTAATGNVVVTAAGGVASAGVPFTVTAAGSTGLNIGRHQHSATLLNNGKILIAGGISCPTAGNCSYLNGAELYDPASGTSTVTGSLTTARSAPALLLPNGKVLIAGGYACDTNGSCASLGGAELYDPAAGTFSTISSLQQARSGHTMTLLQSGEVLIAGGQTCDPSGSCAPAFNAELYDPDSGILTVASTISAPRYDAGAVPLNDGRVLIAGGFDGTTYPATAEIYDPSTGSFIYFSQPVLNSPRSGATATLLNNGKVLVIGGSTCAAGCPSNVVELYDPATNSFSAVTPGMGIARFGHTATLLTNGQVLVAGGYSACTSACNSENTMELYDPATNTFAFAGALSAQRAAGSATFMVSGDVLIAGGISAGVTLSREDEYQPATLTPPGLVSLAVTPDGAALISGASQALGSQALTATGTFADGSTQILHALAWTSSSPVVAAVSNAEGSNGIVAAQGPGPVTVTAAAGTVSGSASATVTGLVSLSVTPSTVALPLPGTQRFSASGTMTDGTTRDFSNNVFWNSSDSSVVTISNASGAQGVVLSLNFGTVSITGSLGQTSASASVSVPAPSVTPTITSVTPNAAPAGTQITINGTGFGGQQSPGSVLLGTTLGNIVSWSDVQVVATVAPASRTGTVQVQQADQWSNSANFTVIVPVISGVSPSTGAAGTQVTINGSGFGSAPGSILLGNASASVTSWSDGQVITSVPPNATSGTVQLQQAGVWSNGVNFAVNTVTVASVSPQSGLPGTQVTISGTGFGTAQGNGNVWLGTAYGNIISWNDTAVVAAVAPGSLSGTAQILQNGVWSNPVTFTVPSPQITSVVPDTASAGATVTITGSGFGLQASGNVWIGSAYAAVGNWSDMQIVATVADTAHSGVAKVIQGGIWSNSVKFTVPPSFSNGPQVTLTPNPMNMLVGETRSLQAVDSSNNPVAGLTWASSDPTIAGLSTDDPPVITALAPGHVVISAGGSSSDLTVYLEALPPGTVKWSVTGDGSGISQILPAVPSSAGVADVFALQASGNVQAITSEGRVAWSANAGTDPSLKLLPDFQGGLITWTSQSLMRLDGMTGQPQALNFSTNGFASVVPHTDGTIFALDGDSLVGIDPATGTPKFRIPMEHSSTASTSLPGGICFTVLPTSVSNTDSLPQVGKLIIAGDGFAYLAYQYSSITTVSQPCSFGTSRKEVHLRVLRVGSDGSSTKINIADWTESDRFIHKFSTEDGTWTNGVIPTVFDPFLGAVPGVTTADLITNADQGVLLSWQATTRAYCAAVTVNPVPFGPDITSGCVGAANVFKLTTISGGAVATEVATNLPGQSTPLQPVLQSADGTYFGTVSVRNDPVDPDLVQSLLVAFNANGNIEWDVPNLFPLTATAGGGLIATSGASNFTVDMNGAATGQTTTSSAVTAWSGNWYGGSAALGTDSYAFAPKAWDSSFWPDGGANPSGNSSAGLFTKEITIIGWIDPLQVQTPTGGSSALVDKLTGPLSCPLALRDLSNGDRSAITSDDDRKFVNWFLITFSSNREPPRVLDPSVLSGGNFRAFNRVQVNIHATGTKITSAQFLKVVTVLGDTPDACHSPFTTMGNYIVGGGKLLKPEAHPDNGKHGITPSQLHAFQLAEGRVGAEAQKANMTLNACTSQDAAGLCNAPVPPVTPYIWSFPLFDSKGQYTVNTQIFPTYYIYEDGTFKTKIVQGVLETFIHMNSSSQISASDIQ